MSEQTMESRHPRRPARGDALLVVDNVTLRFGGVVALNEVAFEITKGEILGLIGPNGAGKTTCFNVDDRRLHADVGRDPLRRRADQRRQAAPDQRPRHRPHVPEHPAVPGDDGAWRTSWSAPTPGTRPACSGALFRLLPGQAQGARAARTTALTRGFGQDRSASAGTRSRSGPAEQGDGAAALRRHRRPRPRAGPQPALRLPAAARDRPRPGHRAQAALPRRAGGRLQPGREGRPDGPDPADPRPRATRCC